MDTTKEGVKALLEEVNAKTPALEWHSQAAHKIAVGIFALNCLNITEQADRSAFMKQWLATPASFGCNASAMAQQLGRPSAKAKIDATFADY